MKQSRYTQPVTEHEMQDALRDYRELAQLACQRAQEHYGDNLCSVVLYGSVARGRIKRNSDIDLLIVLKCAPKSVSERNRQFTHIPRGLYRTPLFKQIDARAFYPNITPIILTREEALRTRPIYLDMTEEGVLLVDDGTMASKLEQLRERMRELGTKRVFLPDGSWYWDLKPGLKLGEVVEL